MSPWLLLFLVLSGINEASGQGSAGALFFLAIWWGMVMALDWMKERGWEMTPEERERMEREDRD